MFPGDDIFLIEKCLVFGGNILTRELLFDTFFRIISLE